MRKKEEIIKQIENWNKKPVFSIFDAILNGIVRETLKWVIGDKKNLHFNIKFGEENE